MRSVGAAGLHEAPHDMVSRSDVSALCVLATQYEGSAPEHFKRRTNEEVSMSFHHVNPLQWHQAVGVARQSCARFFRDGGTPADALLAFGLRPTSAAEDWSRAVDAIAERCVRRRCAAPPDALPVVLPATKAPATACRGLFYLREDGHGMPFIGRA